MHCIMEESITVPIDVLKYSSPSRYGKFAILIKYLAVFKSPFLGLRTPYLDPFSQHSTLN